MDWSDEAVDVVFDGTKINKRPTVSKDLYRLLRTLRSDPSIHQNRAFSFHEKQRRSPSSLLTKEMIPETSYLGPNDVILAAV